MKTGKPTKEWRLMLIVIKNARKAWFICIKWVIF